MSPEPERQASDEARTAGWFSANRRALATASVAIGVLYFEPFALSLKHFEGDAAVHCECDLETAARTLADIAMINLDDDGLGSIQQRRINPSLIAFEVLKSNPIAFFLQDDDRVILFHLP